MDIGCFKGKLIKIIKRNYNKSNIYAYDTNRYLKKYFKNSNINFSHKFKFNKVFNFIIISHSLQYVPNLRNFFIKIKKIINKETIIFIQLPDLNKNLFNNSFGDQYYLFSKEFLYNLIKGLNFKIIKYEKIIFPMKFYLL